jgi:hypothetical protein
MKLSEHAIYSVDRTALLGKQRLNAAPLLEHFGGTQQWYAHSWPCWPSVWRVDRRLWREIIIAAVAAEGDTTLAGAITVAILAAAAIAATGKGAIAAAFPSFAARCAWLRRLLIS